MGVLTAMIVAAAAAYRFAERLFLEQGYRAPAQGQSSAVGGPSFEQP
jgi:hypothetical protein